MSQGKRIVIFPGSFDPFTIGHANLVERGLLFFDEVIIAVGYNENKAGWITPEERVAALRKLYADIPNVRVESYTCLTTDFAEQVGAVAILRGIRSVKDYEYELQIADINRQLTSVETVLLPALPQLSSISSSVVRELAHFGKDIRPFLPKGLIYSNIK